MKYGGDQVHVLR